MCKRCYEEEGSPRIVNESTVAAAAAISKVFEYSCVGGNAHVVIDDWNVEDWNINAALRDWLPENVHDADDAQLEAEREALERLLALSYDERVSALAIHDQILAVPSR